MCTSLISLGGGVHDNRVTSSQPQVNDFPAEKCIVPVLRLTGPNFIHLYIHLYTQ